MRKSSKPLIATTVISTVMLTSMMVGSSNSAFAATVPNYLSITDPVGDVSAAPLSAKQEIGGRVDMTNAWIKAQDNGDVNFNTRIAGTRANVSSGSANTFSIVMSSNLGASEYVSRFEMRRSSTTGVATYNWWVDKKTKNSDGSWTPYTKLCSNSTAIDYTWPTGGSDVGVKLPASCLEGNSGSFYVAKIDFSHTDTNRTVSDTVSVKRHIAPTNPTVTPPVVSDYTLVAQDDFNTFDTSKWAKYTGTPGCCPDGNWSPNRVNVANGVLTLSAAPNANGVWEAGGVGGWNYEDANAKYGKWEARVRFDAGSGVSAAALLYPHGDTWPPEIDFFEIFHEWGARDKYATSTHRGTPTDHHVNSKHTSGDFTTWNTVGVEWSPTSIKYLLNDQVVHTVSDPAYIPTMEMWPGFQSHVHKTNNVWPVLPAGKTSIDFQIDWFKAYSYTG